MIIKDSKFLCDLDENIVKNYALDNLVFFDIEATGFNVKKDWVFALSFCTIVKGYLVGKTFVCNNIKDEKALIEKFISIIENKGLCSYNGKAFDEPFLRKRALIYGIDFPKNISHRDLYREIRPYKNGLNIESLSLKDIEKTLNIDRDEETTAVECMHLYKRYLETSNEKFLNKIIRYNFNDVRSLPYIFNLINEVKSKNIIREDVIDEIKRKEILRLCLNNNIFLEESICSNISKKAGGRILFKLYNKDISKKEIEDIINNSY